MAQPVRGEQASSHQPSGMLRLSTPLKAAFMPLLVGRGDLVPAPDLVGRSLIEARAVAEDAGLGAVGGEAGRGTIGEDAGVAGGAVGRREGADLAFPLRQRGGDQRHARADIGTAQACAVQPGGAADDDAVIVDSTTLSIDEVLDRVLEEVRRIFPDPAL